MVFVMLKKKKKKWYNVDSGRNSKIEKKSNTVIVQTIFRTAPVFY